MTEPAGTDSNRGRPSILIPSRWPVQWRLAGVSATLTFVILLMFAAVVGRLAEDRLESNFTNELESTASELAFNVQIDPVTGRPVPPAEFDGMALGADATIRILNSEGPPLELNARPLPPPQPETVRFGDLEVATAQVISNSITAPPTFVQYARDHEELDATVGKLWLLLAIGVAGGAMLATLAGLAVAGRAMRPIAALTATAREIASTRDPARTMPKSEADDEVAELARTLDEMLSQLDAARTEAQQMVQAQREFVADASHELRTPLTSILANLELLQHSLESSARGDGEESEMVASALRSSQRMRRLVGDLLILARADAGRQGARRPCDLAEVAEAAVAEVRPVAGEHAIELMSRQAKTYGNPDELHRLAVNLIDNGVRHTSAGTTIRVAVFMRGSEAIMEVSDDGPGIPDGMADQVFGRFVRGAGPADVAGDSGTGLGLAIVRAVATSHGGDVEAGRSPLGGARFTVKLPLLGERIEAPSEVSAIL